MWITFTGQYEHAEAKTEMINELTLLECTDRRPQP